MSPKYNNNKLSNDKMKNKAIVYFRTQKHNAHISKYVKVFFVRNMANFRVKTGGDTPELERKNEWNKEGN